MMDENVIAMVLLWIMCVCLLIIAILTERKIKELKHDLKQLKFDSHSHAYGLRTVTCAIAKLEMQTENNSKKINTIE